MLRIKGHVRHYASLGLIIVFVLAWTGCLGPTSTFVTSDHLDLLSRGSGPTADAACSGWRPSALRIDDPPDCTRAKQFRQIQAFRLEPRYSYEPDIWAAVDDLESCVLGYVECPPRPLIVSSWWYMYNGLRGGVSGEEVWMKSVAYYIGKEGFVLMSTFHKARAIHLTRALSHSVHMFWAQDIYGFECTTNPRCIRMEDYYPADEASIRHDPSGLPEWERGTLPLWRIFVTSYWGARPTLVGSPGMNAWHDWRLPENVTEWSYNPLGRHMVITPFAYPGHSWIPYSLERECLSTPVIPHDQRSNNVLVLAKESIIFDRPGWTDAMLPAWPSLAAHLAESGHQFTAYADINEGYPIPPGVVNGRKLSRRGYTEAVSTAKAMLGINKPEISPSPYLALCRGVPVVLPYKGATPTPDGWELYERKLVQHGPLNLIGEPYVYTYNIEDMEDMKAKIDKAISTPIEPFVPPDNTELSVRRQVRQVLYHDYEADYVSALRRKGGRPPRNPEHMRERCFELGVCTPGPQPE